MANKQKAWRTQAAAVNKRRAAGSKEATARVQKADTVKMLGMPSPLWIGLMIRAGFYDPLPAFRGENLHGTPMQIVPKAKSKSWLSNAWAKAKRWFS